MELALDVESILPHFIRRKFVVKCLVIKPNVSSHFLLRLTGVKSLSSEAIARALDPEVVCMLPCTRAVCSKDVI